MQTLIVKASLHHSKEMNLFVNMFVVFSMMKLSLKILLTNFQKMSKRHRTICEEIGRKF